MTVGLEEERGKGVGISGALHSIRTQYSLATAFFLLLILGLFYIGGRIVLVHMVREAETQVREVGQDISRLAYRNAGQVQTSNLKRVVPMARGLADGRLPVDLLDEDATADVSMLVNYSSDGEFLSGAVRAADDGEAREIAGFDLAPYAARIGCWIEGLSSTNDTRKAVGIMRVKGSTHYVSLARYEAGKGGFLVIGSPFDPNNFTAQANEGVGGAQVRVINRKADVSVVDRPSGLKAGGAKERNAFGLAPMLSEALDFYSGGFWNIGSTPFEAIFSIRDIAGNPITIIRVSLPQAFSNVTSAAIGRLTFFISMAGIILILPIFWFQSRVLLNPLTKMTEAIRNLGSHHMDTDCPRLDWEGKDEFALLAGSVNRMLETISARTVELSQLESRQRALIACVPDALVVFDRSGRLVSVYKQADGKPIPGLVAGEKSPIELYSENQIASFKSQLEETFKTGVATRTRGCIGSELSPDVRYFELRLTKMDEHFALGIIRDTTREVAEHKMRLDAEKRASDASKRESLTLLAAGIAHDVNNVLSVILNTAQAAIGASPHPEVQEAMAVIRDAVKRGSAMSKELMAYAGQSKISLVRTNADVIVKDVQMIAERVLEKNVALSYRLGSDLPAIDADPGQFWKVLFNIIKNAGEAIGPRPGNICLSTDAFEMTEELAAKFISEHPLPPGKGVMFRIADDGPGIQPEFLSRMFDPYVSSKALGRGLGLATVRTIVEEHGGGIRVTSVVDQGTTFHIFLPESKLAAETVSEAKPKVSGEMPAEVMIVDNDEAILKTTSILLKMLKVQAHVARDRHESLGILRRRTAQIGAILLDANLGGIDTLRLLDAFRIAAPNTPVIVSSGSSEDALRKMFEAHPFDAFLGKPYSINELKEILLSCNKS